MPMPQKHHSHTTSKNEWFFIEKKKRIKVEEDGKKVKNEVLDGKNEVCLYSSIKYPKRGIIFHL